MNIQFAFIKSKVAKRIFILFVIAAIIPISVIGVISYNYVTNLLSEQKHKHLTVEGKSYGMAIFDRILVAESQLIGVGESLVQSNSIDIDQKNMVLETSNNSLLKNIKVYNSLLIHDNAEYKHLLDGKTKITINDTGESKVITFSRLLNTIDATTLLSAEINKGYIFGDMDTFAGDNDACVISLSVGLLNCSNDSLNELALPSFRKYFDSKNDTNIIELNGNNYIVASWELFLNGNFKTDSWIIYYTVPSNVIFAPINSFSRILFPILLLTILIVSLISINQISRILVPLEILSFLTKKIAKREFKHNVEFDSGDEFQELGESFNAMSNELGRQFTVMTAMSNLDRAILTTMNKEIVVESIFKNLEDYLEYNYASVILIDNNNEINGDLYIYNKTLRKIHANNLVKIHEKDINLLLGYTNSYVRTLDRNKLRSLEWLDKVHSSYITTIDIKQKYEHEHEHEHEHETIALIIIGHQFIPQLNNEDMEQLDNYVDRVNVALNAIEREERLIRQANFDALTGLPNRQKLINKFNALVSQSKEIQELAIIFLDLDSFKIINDSQGHAIGDKLLIEASKRIQSCVDEKAFVARYGGDEFVILYPYDIDSNSIAEISNKIIMRLSKLFTIDNYEQYIGASIGISIYPRDGNNWDKVLQHADIAMYKAKQKGRGRYLFFSDTMQSDIQDKASLQADLFHSIEKDELYMLYQPQIDIASGEITGAETLMRWEHSTKGNVRPDIFISYAEDTGFIVPLGLWAMRTTLKQCEAWQLEGNSLPKISINVSPKQFRHEDFISDIEALITDFDMNKTNIEFEITESIFLNDDISILDKLHHINKLGISISIDDFGKGYSLLSYLKKFPVQTLKIDKLFIDDLEKDRESVEIVKAIIAMARSLNKTIVAEGVETIEQLNILKDLDCDIAQGYFISKPKPASEIMDYSKTVIISLEHFRANKIIS